MKATRIILDTDLAMGDGANIDDGFALALAVADPALQLDMITTVHGNTDVESATILTGTLARQLGLNKTPIVMGAATPLIRPHQSRTPAPHVLAIREKGFSLSPASGIAANAIIDHIMSNPGEITVIAIGPLTNIALALLLNPGIITSIKELVVMGGVFFGTTGSRSKPGETNVFTDPEAAQAVLRSGIPQRWVGLDCTLRTRMTVQQAKELESESSEFAAFAGTQALAYIDKLAQRFPGRGICDSCPIHDALAVAIVSHPEICDYMHVLATVVTGEGEARGVMVVDRLEGIDPPSANCRVAFDVSTKAFDQHFFRLIRNL